MIRTEELIWNNKQNGKKLSIVDDKSGLLRTFNFLLIGTELKIKIPQH